MDGPVTDIPSPSSRPLDEALLLKALQEADAELPDAETSGSSSMTPEQIEEERNSGLLGSINQMLSPPKILDAAATGVVEAGMQTKDFIAGEPAEGDKSLFRQAHEKNFKENKEAGFFTSATQSISQMVTGLVGAGKLMKPVKFLQGLRNGGTAGRAAFEITRGAAASTIVLDPHEDRLSDLIENYPALQNPVTAYLASDPEDSTAEGRFKNAIESIGLDFALVGAVKVVKLLRSGQTEEALKEIKKLEAGGSAARADIENPGLQASRDVDPKATADDVTEQIGMGQPIGKNGQRELPTDVKEPGVLRVQEVTDEELDSILKGSAADSLAIRKYGSFEDAVEAGHKFGANTRLPWQKLRGTTETMTFVRQTAKVLKDRYDIAKGGARLGDARVRDVTREIAEAFNEDPAVVLGQITEMGEKATQVVPYMEASLRIGNKMFLDADKLASDIRLGNLESYAGNVEAANAELKARLAAAVDVMANANSMLANSGRALRRARSQFRVRDADLQSIKNLDPNKLAIIMEKAGGDPRKIMMLANRKWSDRVMDEATWHLTNGLLWMWPTHLVNTTTNTMMLFARPTEKLFGSAALRLLTNDPGRKAELSSVSRQSLREYTYTMTSLMDGWFSAVEAFRRGDSILSPHNTEYFQGGSSGIGPDVLPWKPVKGVWDLVQNAYISANYRNFVGLPTRGLGAADEMFKTMRYRAVIQSKAAVDAADRGLNAADTRAFIQRALDEAIDPDTGAALNKKALRESQMVGFQQDLDYETTIGGSLGRAAVSARRVAPVISLVLPFIKTPINVLRYGIKLAPGLNMAQREFRDALTGKVGLEAQAHATGQMAMGMMFASVAASMAASGRLTGGGPKDPELKRELMASGWRPYSIVWEGEDGNKQYLQWQRFDPAAMAMGIVTDIVTQQQMHPDRSIDEAAGAVVLALAQNLGDRTFLLSLNNAVQAVMDPEKFPTYVARTLGSMVPASTLLKEHNPDPYIREARGFFDNLIRGVPGLSVTLPKVYDVFGDPMERTLALAGTQDFDIVEAEHNRIMLQTEKSIGRPEPRFEGVDLRDIRLDDGRTAYLAYQKLSGHLPGQKPLRHLLAREIVKPSYQDLPDGEPGVKGTRINRLATITGQYRDAARKHLVRQYPELRQHIKQRQKEARGAFIKNREERRQGQPGAQELLKALGH